MAGMRLVFADRLGMVALKPDPEASGTDFDQPFEGLLQVAGYNGLLTPVTVKCRCAVRNGCCLQEVDKQSV